MRLDRDAREVLGVLGDREHDLVVDVGRDRDRLVRLARPARVPEPSASTG